jgi:hypothetical protein
MASPGINPAGINTASVQGGSLLISAIPIGPIALASIGANTTDAIQLFLTELFVPCNRFASKIGILQGGTAGTDSIIGVIYDSTGALVGSTTLAGTALNSSANTFLEMAIIRDSAGVLVTGVQLFGPGQYFVGVQGNGTAAGAIQTYAAPHLMPCNSAAAGVFATLPATITVPTAFVASKGPVAYIK